MIATGGSEHDQQATFFQMVRRYRDNPWYPKLQAIFAVPNGGERAERNAVTLYKEGVEPGVPDVLAILPGPIVLAIEFKAPGRGQDKSSIMDYSTGGRGKKLSSPLPTLGCSDYQLGWATILVEAGCWHKVSDNWQDAWNWLCTWTGYLDLLVRE